ncbi:lipoma-preferred partner homolog isoform X2 [Liolophura sinensis]|uniref:lipoma-preferred partner homolog isoform X2 n=1 Tax=Liolophura sinensis TaxID=3198878 RepID=UPI0031588264
MAKPATGLEREFGYMMIQEQNQHGALPPGLAPRPKPQHDAPKPYRPGVSYRSVNYHVQQEDDFPPPPPPQGQMGYGDDPAFPPPPPLDQGRAYHYADEDYPPPPPPGQYDSYPSHGQPVSVRTTGTGYSAQTSYGNPANSYNNQPDYPRAAPGGDYRNKDQTHTKVLYGSSPTSNPSPAHSHSVSSSYADVSGLPSHGGSGYAPAPKPSPPQPAFTRPSTSGQVSSGMQYHAAGPTKLSEASNSAGKEAEVDALTNLLLQNMESAGDPDFFGMCAKCGKQVIGENNGCTAMDQVYHITCFICVNCTKMLRGLPFYSMENKPYCEECYLNTLEKCSVCSKIITDRLLRATGKPYHPACFTCVVCGKSLDGIPFTVDATNQIHCIEDFHKKFAPRCCVCHHPIMPEPGNEETVRVVAMDRSFHVNCYRCEDCGMLLSSEAEGRGCYPLDDHILCKNCNAKRIQAMTTKMTTEL